MVRGYLQLRWKVEPRLKKMEGLRNKMIATLGIDNTDINLGHEMKKSLKVDFSGSDNWAGGRWWVWDREICMTRVKEMEKLIDIEYYHGLVKLILISMVNSVKLR